MGWMRFSLSLSLAFSLSLCRVAPSLAHARLLRDPPAFDVLYLTCPALPQLCSALAALIRPCQPIKVGGTWYAGERPAARVCISHSSPSLLPLFFSTVITFHHRLGCASDLDQKSDKTAVGAISQPRIAFLAPQTAAPRCTDLILSPSHPTFTSTGIITLVTASPRPDHLRPCIAHPVIFPVPVPAPGPGPALATALLAAFPARRYLFHIFPVSPPQLSTRSRPASGIRCSSRPGPFPPSLNYALFLDIAAKILWPPSLLVLVLILARVTDNTTLPPRPRLFIRSLSSPPNWKLSFCSTIRPTFA